MSTSCDGRIDFVGVDGLGQYRCDADVTGAAVNAGVRRVMRLSQRDKLYVQIQNIATRRDGDANVKSGEIRIPPGTKALVRQSLPDAGNLDVSV